MIAGIGVDIVSVERIKKLYEKFSMRFLNRVFNEREIHYCFRHSNPFPHLAARFAAKEAFIKAFKKSAGLRLKDIEIISNVDGSPDIVLPEAFRERIFLSISHEQNHAIAFVVVSKEN